MESSFDVIVIGAGAVGENAAAGAAAAGLSVAVVESDLVGGECSYWACMPSKALLRPGEAVAAARRTPGASAAVTGDIDIEAVFERRNLLAANWDDSGQVEWLESNDVTVLRGQARLAGEKVVEVSSGDGGTSRHQATKAVVVATGSTPITPDIPGIDAIEPWTSREATSADSVPPRLLVIGGGAVGTEMAQAWAWLGSEVTLVHRSDHLLSQEEDFAGNELQVQLERMGITVLTRAEATRVEPAEGGGVTATVEMPDETIAITSDRLLIATGRTGRTKDIGLDTVGMEVSDFIEVNDHMQAKGVQGGWLYAVGDVNGRALFTHVGKYQARIAGAHIGGVSGASVTPVESTPRVIFTSPEVAAVGLTEQQARSDGFDVGTVTRDIGRVAGAATLGKGYSGTVKLVIDRSRNVIIGATFVGPKTGELLHSATIAIVGEVSLETLWHAVPSFPTLSEVWLRLLEEYRDQGWDPFGPSKH